MKERRLGDLVNDIEEWVTFGKRFENVGFSSKSLERIKIAYKWAVDIHHGDTRKDKKTPFVTHPISAAMIYFQELGGRNPSFIVALLMHDVVEMSRFWGNFDRLPYSEWVTDARERLTPNFGKRATDLIIAVTKPVVDDVEIKTKEEAMKRYFENLSSNPDAILIKMADRLHNLRDFAALSIEECRKIVDETQILYFPLFEKAKAKYPKEYLAMFDKVQAAVAEIQKTLN